MSMLWGLEEGCQVGEEGGQLAQTFLEQLRSMGNVLEAGGQGESEGTSALAVVAFPSLPSPTHPPHPTTLHICSHSHPPSSLPQSNHSPNSLPFPFPTSSQPCIISPTIRFLPLLFILIVLPPLLFHSSPHPT